jgi:hypothetical protein
MLLITGIIFRPPSKLLLSEAELDRAALLFDLGLATSALYGYVVTNGTVEPAIALAPSLFYGCVSEGFYLCGTMEEMGELG